MQTPQVLRKIRKRLLSFFNIKMKNMKKINDFKIGARINIIFNSAFMIIMVILSLYTIRSQRKNIQESTDTRLFEQVDDLANTVKKEVEQNQKMVNSALEIGTYVINKEGRLSASNQYITVEVKNQSTNESQTISIKNISINGVSVHNSTKIVDEIKKLTSMGMTIFQKIPQGYLRISTSTLQADGSRKTDIFIPNETPVAEALNKGENYQGRIYMDNQWHISAYKPLKLDDGTVLALGTGSPEKEMSSLKRLFDSKKYFETGYPFLVSREGILEIHPSSEGKDVSKTDIQKKMLADEDGRGSFNYVWEGKLKVQYFNYIPECSSFVAVSVYQNEFMKAVHRQQYAIILAMILGLALFIIITLTLSRSITSALKKGIDFAKRIANGDLTAELKIDQQDEIGELAQALSNMLARLKEIVMNITNGAESIAAASAQISNGSQQMSQGATEQASSTEEISSSMEEMVSNIQQNTDNAKQTESMSMKAQGKMNELGTLAKESFDSIKLITEKISIVNDIAFQTNLLALNAAVEAARAGEHGRGFAVVAAEVRKLAERSKLAADEIVTLSKDGLRMTEKAQESMLALIPEVEKTSQLVQEIASASIEQNSGADQINSALQQLNIITQQNAASSEEMATSAEELSSQAESLKDSVSFFRIEGTTKRH
jgi:methyl-accepting chemotaxis protein